MTKTDTKNTPKKPVILLTREGMESAITDYFALQLKRKRAVLKMEEEKLAVEKKHETELNDLAADIELRFASIQNYCELHRDELMPTEKKSFETVNAEVKFAFTPHAVETVGKESEKTKAKRLQGLVFPLEGDKQLDCGEKYVRIPEPVLNKAALLQDRSLLTPAQLRIMGITFSQTETFSVTPKSELVDATSATVGAEEAKAA